MMEVLAHQVKEIMGVLHLETQVQEEEVEVQAQLGLTVFPFVVMVEMG
jgi:hypothetical protein